MSYPTAHSTTIHNPRLRYLNALKDNTKPITTFLGLPSFRGAQIVAQTGFDVSTSRRQTRPISPTTFLGVIIDCEHGNISDDSMHTLVAAIAAFDVSPLVRLRGTGSDLIKRALDAGAQYVPEAQRTDY